MFCSYPPFLLQVLEFMVPGLETSHNRNTSGSQFVHLYQLQCYLIAEVCFISSTQFLDGNVIGMHVSRKIKRQPDNTERPTKLNLFPETLGLLSRTFLSFGQRGIASSVSYPCRPQMKSDCFFLSNIHLIINVYLAGFFYGLFLKNQRQ